MASSLFLLPSAIVKLFKSSLPSHASPSKPSTIAMSDRRGYYSSAEADIHSHLFKSLPTTVPPVIAEPMRHLLFAAAKTTIAPVVCLAGCELVGGPREAAIDIACALHVLHAAADVHRPTALLRPRNTASSAAAAAHTAMLELMSGDALHPLGYELAARSKCQNPERVARVIVELAKAMGPDAMVEGQLMEADEADGDATLTGREKTEGALTACAAACGAIVGGGSEEAVERLRKFGFYVGVMHGLLRAEGRKKEAMAEEFRASARMELQGFDFEENKAEVVHELVDLWYQEGLK